MKRRDLLKSAAIPLTMAGGLNAVPAEAGDPLAEMSENLPADIQQRRDAALAILQPSARDLEHGLKLHADSLVFDSYSFSPTSAIDGETIREATMAGASAAAAAT